MGFSPPLINSQEILAWTPNHRSPRVLLHSVRPQRLLAVLLSLRQQQPYSPLDKALSEGWEDITGDIDLVQANYVGQYSGCKNID